MIFSNLTKCVDRNKTGPVLQVQLDDSQRVYRHEKRGNI